MDEAHIQKLKAHLDNEQWATLQRLCIENGIPMDEDALEYGSPFLMAKYWFVLGWNAGPGER